jgi:RNA polymerase sigma-54 factor
MALATRLELRQGQQLVMTPQLQQAIRLLQLSNFELTQYVESELERNPLLERDESSEAPLESEDREPAAEANGSSSEHALDLDGRVVDAGATLDTEYDNVYPDTPRADMDRDASLGNWSTVRQRTHNGFDDDTNLEDYVAGETSLKDHLSAQLPLALQAPADRLVGQYLIDLVDEAGYLTANLAEIAEKLGAPSSLVEKVLATLQTFDPVGVFARSLGECLALQLKEQNRYDPQIASLLDNLHLLAQHNVAALRRAVGVEMDELAEMVSEIKRLDPKPGLRFGHVEVQAIVPDVLVRAAADGSWIVELNSDTLPRVLVNRSYYSRVSRIAHTEKDKDYLVECLQTANWLVKSLDQRARTILKVAEEIVRQQDGFLTHGVEHLRPLNLKKVADAISMHESTVSRVTSNKYMATPRGIFELKYFFTSSIASSEDEGEAHSSEAVRHRIKQLIESESAADVLSDDRIVDILKGTGIDIARRTVAKYREALRIPSSVQRRREKRLSEQVGRAM